MNTMRAMSLMLVAGLVAVGTGLYLLFFTEIVNDQGTTGITWIVFLLTIGFVLLIPAKVYIVLQLMKRERQKQVLHRSTRGFGDRNGGD